MNRGAALGLIVGAIVLTIVAVLVLRREAGPALEEGLPVPETLPVVEPGQGEVARLYFPGSDARLHAVERELPLEGSTEVRARILVLALLEGPEAAGAEPTAGLVASLPPGTGIRHVFNPQPGLLLVDLEPPPDPAAFAMGSRQELLAVYSLVDTLGLNLDGVERVGLLVAGIQRATFAGHVDTSVPLVPDRRLVAPPKSTGG